MNPIIGEFLGYACGFCTTIAFLAPGNKINTQSQCIWAVMADLYHLLRGLCIMDVIWGVFEFVSDGIV